MRNGGRRLGRRGENCDQHRPASQTSRWPRQAYAARADVALRVHKGRPLVGHLAGTVQTDDAYLDDSVGGEPAKAGRLEVDDRVAAAPGVHAHPQLDMEIAVPKGDEAIRPRDHGRSAFAARSALKPFIRVAPANRHRYQRRRRRRPCRVMHQQRGGSKIPDRIHPPSGCGSAGAGWIVHHFRL